MAISRTHYDNLKVARNAPHSVIKAAYKALCQNYHPDKYPGSPEEAERIIKVINEAYAVLSDPVKRAEHDAWIADEEKKIASAAAAKKQDKGGKGNPFRRKAKTNKSRQETECRDHQQNAENTSYDPHAYYDKPHGNRHAANTVGEKGSELKAGGHHSDDGFHLQQDDSGNPKLNSNPKATANFFRHRALLVLVLALAAGSGIFTTFLTDANPIPSAETPETPAALPAVAAKPPFVSKPAVASKSAVTPAVNITKQPQTTRKADSATNPKLLPSKPRERMLAAAQILEDKPLTIQKLTEAYNLYRDVEMQQPRNQEAKRGIGKVFRERIKIDKELGKNLASANTALKAGRLAGSGSDNAAAYYRNMLLLDNEHPKALLGLAEIAELYLGRAEAELKRNATAAALENVRLGLSVQEGHPKLLALAAKLQANSDAGLRLSGITENTGEASP